MAKKNDFVEAFLAYVTNFAETSDASANLANTYFSRGYNTGGSDPITDADLTQYGITASELGDGINMAQQIDNFVNNAAVLQSLWRDTVNGLRTDI